MATNVPNESWNGVNSEEYEVPIHYCKEQDVYNATGFTSEFLQKIGKINGVPMKSDQVSALINGFIAAADGEIRRRLGVPIDIRKERHAYFNNPWVQLGPDREDDFEFYGAFEPLDKVLAVYGIWYGNYKTKNPYPKNVVQFTEPSSISYWDAVNATVTSTTDPDYVIAGTGSIEIEITSAGGKAIFPKQKNLNLRVYPWLYTGMLFMTDKPDAKFSFKLCRDSGSYFGCNFKVKGQLVDNDNYLYAGFGASAMTWVPLGLNIRAFTFNNLGNDPQNSVSDFNFILTPTQWLEISADQPCKIWLSALNFNDGFFASYPQGYIYWCMPMQFPSGEIEVTYAYDPYLKKVPEPLREASAKWAGVKLYDWCIGKRQMNIAFMQQGDTLEENPDKETLEASRRRLRQEGFDALASMGFMTFEGGGF